MEKSPFLSFSREQQRSAVEALLFASDDSLSSRALYKLLIEADEQAAQQEQATDDEPRENTPQNAGDTDQTGEDGAEQREQDTAGRQKQSRTARMKELTALFEELIDEINAELDSTGRAFRIVRVAGGYQFATTAMHGELVARLVKSKSKRRLSQAALETLAIVAYRQPITKPEIEAIRGVSCSEVVNTLLEKNLVTIAGRSDSIGKPLLYGTTDEFLRAFGLHDITDLPKPRELEELMESRADILNAETVVFAEGEAVEEFEERLQALGHGQNGTTAPQQQSAEDGHAGKQTEPATENEETAPVEQTEHEAEEQPEEHTPSGDVAEATDSHEQENERKPEAPSPDPQEQEATDEPAGENAEPTADGRQDDVDAAHDDAAEQHDGDSSSQKKMRLVMTVNGRPA